MQSKYTKFMSAFVRVVSSDIFFWCVVAYFVCNSLWFVFTALYPMAFDEEFHLGIIQIYTQHWSPFISSQPAGTEYLSGVPRDPSFFFHYVMSFPLRIVQLFTDNTTVQIISLRLINVGLLTTAFFIYRRLLLSAKQSKFVAHSALALFTLIPIVTLLGAQINYDNAMIPLTGLALIYTLKICKDLRAGNWSIKNVLILVSVMLLASIIKYVFLPLAVGMVLYMLWTVWRSISTKQLLLGDLAVQLRQVPKKTYVVLLSLIIVGLTLFAQRYVVNIMDYGTPLPSCDQVLSSDACAAYGPWNRNNLMTQSLSPEFEPNIVQFTGEWFFGLWERSLFTISGLANTYENYRPLPFIGTTVWVLAVSGFILTLVQLRRVFGGKPALQLFAITTLVYCAILYMENFSQYKETGFFVAINGRYLLPLLPLIFVVYARSFSIFFARIKVRLAAPLLGALVLGIFLLQGGGASGWIVQSSTAWYWDNAVVRSVNQQVRSALKPFILSERSQ